MSITTITRVYLTATIPVFTARGMGVGSVKKGTYQVYEPEEAFRHLANALYREEHSDDDVTSPRYDEEE